MTCLTLQADDNVLSLPSFIMASFMTRDDDGVSHHKLTVESISWLVWNRLAIVQSQAIQHLDSVRVEVAHATHQRCCLLGQLCQGLLCFFSVVLLHRQEAGS